MGFDWSSLPRPRSARLSVRRSADVGPCAVSYGADADAYAPARSVVAALGVSTKLPGGAKLGLGEDAKVGVEVSPKKMLWLSGRHGRVFLKEDGTAGFKTKAIKINSLAKVAVGASAKQGKIKAAAPDVSVTDLKLKLAGAAALVTMGKALPVAQSIKVPGTPASVLLAANVGAPSPLPDKGGWALDLQALNVSLRC